MLTDHEKGGQVELIEYARVGRYRPLPRDDDPRIMRALAYGLAGLVLVPMILGIVIMVALLIL